MEKLSERDVEIRLAVPADAKAIADVLFDAFSMFREHYTPEAFKEVTPQSDKINQRFAEGAMWVAMDNAKIIGTVSVVPEPEWLYIRSLAVSREVQGQGIAHILIKAIEGYAIENGFDRLFLYTTYFSKGAIELYQKHGFVKGRDTAAEEWFGTPGLEMSKRLNRKST